MQYLDSNLVLYKDYAYKSNFESLLSVLWVRLLKVIEESLKKDDPVSFGQMVKNLELHN